MPINTTGWNRARYTLWAPVYNAIAGQFKPQRRRAIAMLEPLPGARVLLVGAGTGLDLDFLPPGLEIVATDLTPAMIEKLEIRARKLGMVVDARVMDGQKLDFPDASFDHVMLHLILAVIPDPAACIREAARVLKPNGTIGIFDKFVPENKRPSIIRRLLNPVVASLATDITRHLGPLLEAGGLILRKQEFSLGGLVTLAVAEKQPTS
jgi:phosphatidylethanolamine/phosphatidyl-N-methylethanolamine N-methyltransferase